ncbi:MAG: altronate dehydratase family protein [Oscillospiraceae bacterium]|jgi:altronate hydrolase|nr:altronate dehydratase family protein [Oscillospiraceae bacterium]
MPRDFVQIHPADGVAVALRTLARHERIEAADLRIELLDEIPAGHKFALKDAEPGEKILKYGFAIGRASRAIRAGEWVHTHNLATGLSEKPSYSYTPNFERIPAVPPEPFMGYAREDGTVGIRNEIWIIPTVGCVNGVAERLARENSAFAQSAGVDGVYAFAHPYGCSQLGGDHETTRKILANLARHPNAGGVLVLGLGCENNSLETLREILADRPQESIRFLNCQDTANELETGSLLIRELIQYAARFKRTPAPVSRLLVGLKCGGSDGLSGITANPAVGAFSDSLIAQGGSAILTETPEMFGAESILMNRALSLEIFEKIVDMINSFKDYFTSHGQPVYENPSPGNKLGGISTLEDKSLGCVQKGGTAPVSGVIAYGERVETSGLTLLSGPGNDLVSATALAAAGAHMILFTTGRGTPFGAPVPTLKISTNTALFRSKPGWIDFDAGGIAEGTPAGEVSKQLFSLVISTANGQKAKNEINQYREIAILKSGVTL